MLFLRDQVLITPDNKSPIITICSILFFITAFLSVLGRIFTKVAVVRRLDTDDYTIVSAFVLYTGQTVTAMIAANHGLGQRYDSLTPSEYLKLQKALYASILLFIPALVIAKLSVVLFLRSLTTATGDTIIASAFGIGVLLWGIASEFAAAFQCVLPSPWVWSPHCTNYNVFMQSFNALNVATDLFLVIWPSYLIFMLPTSRGRRWGVIFCFSFRLLAVASSVAQICLFSQQEELWKGQRGDPSLDLFLPSIVLQTTGVLSVATACIPYLGRFLDSLESGMLRSDDLRRRRKPGYTTSSTQLNTANGSGENNSWPFGRKMHALNLSIFQDEQVPAGTSTTRRTSTIGGTSTMVEAGRRLSADQHSETSQTKIFKQATTPDIELEPYTTTTTISSAAAAVPTGPDMNNV